MKPVEQCTHDVVSFQSGDYYVMCRECGSMWGRLKPGQREYGILYTGDLVGCSPEAANRGPAVCDQIRVAQGKKGDEHGTS